MTDTLSMRDYSLTGAETKRAEALNLNSAEWYHTAVDRKDMKALMQRSDQPAIRDTIIWLGLMLVFAIGAYLTWGTWWCLPFFFAYGVFYGSASDSRWHECGHGTAFRTQWMNTAVYEIASFMIMRNSTRWRWSHTRHHTDTYIVGLDAEIAVMRPPDLIRTIFAYVGIFDAYDYFKSIVMNSVGVISADDKSFIPEMEWPRVIKVARISAGIYLATFGVAFYTGSIFPLMLIGLPRLYGCWHMVMLGLMQHGGLADNVLDHRMNSRTVYINPISRFIYWNMNYHVEHHMFPMVPYHALPKLHEMVKHDFPAPTASIWAAYKEMLPAWRRQLRGEDYFITRALPDTAKPYRPEFHESSMVAAAAE